MTITKEYVEGLKNQIAEIADNVSSKLTNGTNERADTDLQAKVGYLKGYIDVLNPDDYPKQNMAE